MCDLGHLHEHAAYSFIVDVPEIRALIAETERLTREVMYAFVVRHVRDRAAAEDITARSQGAGRVGRSFNGAAREVSIADDAPEPSVAPDTDTSNRRADLFRFVNELPADQRRVIIERFVEKRSVRDIASRLNQTERAVKQLQFRALQNPPHAD